MVISYVMICTRPSMENDVYDKMMVLSDVIEAYPLFGEYDIIAKVEAEDYNAIGNIVVNKIRSIEGVIDTKTLTAITFAE